MKDYVIVTDSCTDLPYEYAMENDLVTIPLGFTDSQGKTYLNTLNHQDMPIKEFYNLMRKGAMFKTNQVNVNTYYEVFKAQLAQGKAVLAIIFSSALSGCYNSACVAKNLILEEEPYAKITVIDSLCASLGEGLLVHYAVKAKKSGMSYSELIDYIEDLKHNISHWFTVDDIDTLKRGGRLSGATAFVAKTLNIKPVLYVSPEGKLVSRNKKIGRKNSLNEIINRLVTMYDKAKNDIIFICHGDCIDDVNYVKSKITELTGIKQFLVNEVGPVIGSHAGAGVISVFFVGNGR